MRVRVDRAMWAYLHQPRGRSGYKKEGDYSKPAMGHIYDDDDLTCRNDPCRVTYWGQQKNPTECKYPKTKEESKTEET